MNNVIGPIDKGAWRLMRDLKQDIRELDGDPAYEIAVEKEKKLLKELIKDYAKAA